MTLRRVTYICVDSTVQPKKHKSLTVSRFSIFRTILLSKEVMTMHLEKLMFIFIFDVKAEVGISFELLDNNNVRDLGIQFDEIVTMESHAKAVCKSARNHLRNIAKIRRHLTPSATEQIVHAFVTSRLDFGKAMLYRLQFQQIQRFQRVRNWAARLMVGATTFCRATPLLREAHWMPIAVRVEFKTLLPVHRALNGRAPDYVANYVSRRLPPRSLRSSELYLLSVHELNGFGD